MTSDDDYVNYESRALSGWTVEQVARAKAEGRAAGLREAAAWHYQQIERRWDDNPCDCDDCNEHRRIADEFERRAKEAEQHDGR